MNDTVSAMPKTCTAPGCTRPTSLHYKLCYVCWRRQAAVARELRREARQAAVQSAVRSRARRGVGDPAAVAARQYARRLVEGFAMLHRDDDAAAEW
mgnify:CR=1 FL=1